MSLVAMSAELVRLDPPFVERDLVIQTRPGVWLEVEVKK